MDYGNTHFLRRTGWLCAALASALVVLFPVRDLAAAGLEVIFDNPQNAEEDAARAFIRHWNLVREAQSMVHSEIRLPQSVRLIVGGEDGPLYDPETAEIVIPYFFVTDVAERIARLNPNMPADEQEEVVAGVVEHTIYHELGHALVDILRLPLEDREEDAVDTLAAVLMIEGFEEGEHATLDAMEDFFALDALEGNVAQAAFFAEHSLDIDRYYAGICLAYGSSPNTNRDLVQELGGKKATQCVREWRAQRARWFGRLRPFLDPDGEFIRALE